jgi:hypothetical protein
MLFAAGFRSDELQMAARVLVIMCSAHIANFVAGLKIGSHQVPALTATVSDLEKGDVLAVVTRVRPAASQLSSSGPRW